jgi:serine-aspartate repeat-containing protein C/D/E
VQDSGEAGLPGVPIKVENATGLVLTGLTAADGFFQVCGLASGEDFRVTSPVPLGFKQTGPGNGVIAQRLFAKDFAYIIQVCMNNVPNLLFPNAPIPGSIGGVKFQDSNANGARDPGEPPLAGVTIKLTPSGGGPTQTTVTAADGTFLFTGLAAGTYTLTETPPAGFTQTVPTSAGITVVLSANGSSVSNVFGNFNGILTGTISGTKFNDLNGNSVRDPGEPGLAGVTINLANCPTSPCIPPPAAPASIATAVTGADGSFTFSNVAFGSYFVSETVPAGFVRTFPLPPGILVATVDFSHQAVSGLLFGNQQIGGSISGSKFNDLNGNGVRDTGEPGVSGVTIQVRNSAGQLAGTTQTDAAGNFSIANLSPGTYAISEVVPAGSVQTTPGGAGTIAVTLAAGQTASGFLFGNRAAAGSGSISGTKFLDINANGVVDGIDRGFEGVTITLKDSSGNTQTTVSAADGTFKFVNLAPGTYTMSEVIPPGFAQTFPGTPDIPKSFTITLTAGQQATGFIFLNKC